MQWQDHAFIVQKKNFSEKSFHLQVFTEQNGLQNGLIRSQTKSSGALILADFVHVTWKARLEQHLGTFTVEHIKSYTPLCFQSQIKLLLIQKCCLLIQTLPLVNPYPSIFKMFQEFLGKIIYQSQLEALVEFTHFEKNFLQELGYGLALDMCCVTKTKENLAYISPKTGRAVSNDAAGEYRPLLLPFPTIWNVDVIQSENIIKGIGDALLVNEFFFKKFLFQESSSKKFDQFLLYRKQILSYINKVKQAA